MLRKIFRIIDASRIFSLPMSIFSWLIVYVYCISISGNFRYGWLALIGICLVHLACNVLDDYFDYKFLIKRLDFNREEYLKNTQKTKCRYLVCGLVTENDLLATVFIYLMIAFFIGILLFVKCGTGVLWYMVAGGMVAVIYPLMSRICLSEIAVALAYGPILFGGVYYVMCGGFSREVFLLSIPSMLMSVVLLYIHTIMDYSYDLNEGHKTIANCFNSELESLIVLKTLLILSYISIIFLCIFDILDWQVFLTYLTIPLAIDLYNSMKLYSCNPEEIPDRKWYHYPMENREKLEKRNEFSFMVRMYQSRNLMIYFSVFLTISIILSMVL